MRAGAGAGAGPVVAGPPSSVMLLLLQLLRLGTSKVIILEYLAYWRYASGAF